MGAGGLAPGVGVRRRRQGGRPRVVESPAEDVSFIVADTVADGTTECLGNTPRRGLESAERADGRARGYGTIATVISDAAPRKQIVKVRGKRMAYAEMGRGEPVVFLHGNPTSSYLWRNVMPHVAPLARCIALDLIGMGDSEKLDDSGPGRYRFVEHREFLDGALATLGVASNVVWVVHDWGAALGFDWANRHRGATRGIAYMEALVRPVMWAEWPAAARGGFQRFRSADGEGLVLDNNVFVERVLPESILRRLTEAEMAVYRAPYAEPGESRRPTLTWPREIPIDGEPPDVSRIVTDYAEWMQENDLPKLFVNADPGAMFGPHRKFCRGWRNQQEVTVRGRHFIQEDSPHEIGRAVAAFVRRLGG